MRKAHVYVNSILAGTLTENDDYSYTFRYQAEYLDNPTTTAISLTLPKRETEYTSKHLFPFFFNMLSEGANKAMQSRILKVDDKDYFTRLVKTAHTDTIGAVTIKAI